jgi:hypothetical protein
LQHLPLISFPRQTHEYDVPALLVTGLSRSHWKIVARATPAESDSEQLQNKVLLVR